MPLGAGHPNPRRRDLILTWRRPLRLAAFALVNFLVLASASWAQSGPPDGDLLLPINTPDVGKGRIKRLQHCQVNGAVLKKAIFNISLFPDRRVVAVRDRETRSANGDTVWVGRILGEPFSRVTLASRAGAVAGSIEMPRYGRSELFEITPTLAGDSTVSEVQMSGDVCPAVVPVGGGGSGPPIAGDGSVSTIDLLVVYTQASRILYGKTALEAMITAAVADANTTYYNSQINGMLNLKAMVEVAYVEDGNMTNALSRLQGATDGYMDNVHALRETYAADVVSLVCEDTSSAGIGYVMTAPSTGFAPFAFDVVYSGALSGLTLPHEIGHHMGCQHNRENASSAGAYPYAYGMRRCTVDGSGFRSVMSYYCSDAPRIPYFSTPNLIYNGTPLGIAYEADPANSSDNVRCVNNTVATVAVFRGAGSPVPCAVSSLTAMAASSSQVNLGWTDNAANETGVRVYRSVDQATWIEVANLPMNTTSYIDTGVVAATTYFFKVVAYNSSGSAPNSNVAMATTPSVPPPGAPASLTATVVSSSQINLTWSDASTNEAGFVLERSLDGTNFSAHTTLGAGAVSFSDTGLTGSKTHWYRIYAYNAGGSSNYSNTISGTTQAPPPPPTAPSNLALTVKGSFSIAMAWSDKSSNELGFKIERSTNGTTFTPVTTVGAGVVTFTDTGLTAATKYWYRLCSYNAGGNSAYTSAVYATTTAIPLPPAAPTLPTLTTVNNSSLKLGWKDNASNETGFKVERSLDGAAFTQVATTAASVVLFTDTGLLSITKYYYRVRAYNDGGHSAYTTVVSATTPAPPPPPAAPSALALTVRSSSQINLAWTDNATNETGFKIERSLDGVTFTQIGTVAAGTRSYSSTGLVTKTKYYYRVRAYNTGGDSAYSNVPFATTS